MLDDVTVNPQNGGKPEYLVIFFHGLGSSGEAMAEHVGRLLGPELPDAKLRFPSAPLEETPDGGACHSWFRIFDMIWGDRTPDSAEVARRAAAAAKDVNKYIDKVIAEEGIPENRVIIAGFSQGGTMAFYSALLRDRPVAGVYTLSGGALDRLDNPVSKPPVGIVAGEEEKQNYSGAPHALTTYSRLDATGFYTECVIIPGQKHDISPKSMELLAVFTRAVTSPGFRAKMAAEQDNAPPASRRANTGPKP